MYRLTLLLLFFYAFGIAQNEEIGKNKRYLDSAEYHGVDNIKKARLFFDSIQNPEITLKGKLAEYYAVQAQLYDNENNQAALYQSYLKALSYAEKEKKYEIAGNSSLMLFSNIYYVNQDTLAYYYLRLAEKYFSKIEDKYRLLEVKQMPAYAKFLNGEYEESNKLLLKNYKLFENAKKDQYYFLFANYILTSNFLSLNNIDEANKYYKVFKTLKTDSTIFIGNYNPYNVALLVDLSYYHFQNKEMDSTFYYLQNASSSREFMNIPVIKNYFKIYSEVYQKQGDLQKSEDYLDSLKHFELAMLDNTIHESYKIHTALNDSEELIKKQDKQSKNRTFYIVLLVSLLFALTIFIVWLSGRYNLKNKLFTTQEFDFTSLKTKHEKLKVKTVELENYIIQIKSEIKKIEATDLPSDEKNKLKELYTSINIDSGILLEKGTNHIDLLDSLNAEFFDKLNTKHPELDDLEKIICYYLFMDFKNKEIAVFLNRSIRSIESKRYRVTKKIGLDNNLESLVNYLNRTFKRNSSS